MIQQDPGSGSEDLHREWNLSLPTPCSSQALSPPGLLSLGEAWGAGAGVLCNSVSKEGDMPLKVVLPTFHLSEEGGPCEGGTQWDSEMF